MARRGSADAQPIAWALLTVQIIGLGLSWKYFSIEPAVLSALIALCLALGAIATRRHTHRLTKSTPENAPKT